MKQLLVCIFSGILLAACTSNQQQEDLGPNNVANSVPVLGGYINFKVTGTSRDQEAYDGKFNFRDHLGPSTVEILDNGLAEIIFSRKAPDAPPPYHNTNFINFRLTYDPGTEQITAVEIDGSAVAKLTFTRYDKEYWLGFGLQGKAENTIDFSEFEIDLEAGYIKASFSSTFPADATNTFHSMVMQGEFESDLRRK